MRIICCKFGDKFTDWHVDNLKHMIDKYSGLKYDSFEVITDNPYNNVFNKLQMYSKFQDGENLYFDLDVVIFDKLSRLAKDSFRALGGKSLGRIDVKMDHLGVPHFIEANLMPGLRKGYFYRSCVLNLDMSYDEMIFSIANTGLSSH